MALYGVGGTYAENVIFYEVCKIYVRNDKYGIREAIPFNERFGKDLSRCFNDLEWGLEYFDVLTTKLKKAQDGHKVVYEVVGNVSGVAQVLKLGQLLLYIFSK